MSFVARDDGTHFVIPSYRDTLTGRRGAQLRKDILTLSNNYGEYATIQKENKKYEVAFSHDTGYLLGETVWQHFNKPQELVYCEAIPNTTDAILVVVKDGSVYLDGNFPIETVQEELVIFLTQANHFDIYVYGDVPISQVPEDGKFCFEESSVNSFTVLDSPAFPSLPLIKAYHLEPVQTVLQAQGIGVLPTKPILMGILLVGLGYFMWTMFGSALTEPPPPPPEEQVNPYQGFYDEMNSPSPAEQIIQLAEKLQILMSAPGWSVTSVNYGGGSVTAKMISNGATVKGLFDWAKSHDASFGIGTDGVSLSMSFPLTNRPEPQYIYPIKDMLVMLVDKYHQILPSNPMTISLDNKGKYSILGVKLNFNDMALDTFVLLADPMKDLPIVLKGVTLTLAGSSLSGTINFDVLGN